MKIKKEIMAYITSMVNNHERLIERYEELDLTNRPEFKIHEGYLNALQDLLDFIEDIPEGTKNDVEIMEFAEAEIEHYVKCNVELGKENQRLKYNCESYKLTISLLCKCNDKLSKKIKLLEGGKVKNE